jgi:hypothetical protein
MNRRSRHRGALALAAALAALACAGGPETERVGRRTLAPLVARVERARERTFLRPVAARSVAPAELHALLARELDRAVPAELLAREQELAAAVGLLPPGIDLRTALLRLQADSIAGFYAQTDAHLYVVDGVAALAGADEGSVLLHELAHALQDQRSPLLAVLLGLDAEDDLGFAISSLLEGDAVYTELQDESLRSGKPRLAPAVLAARVAADTPEAADAAPRFLRDPLVRAYPLGYALCDALARRGGASELDRALANPPLSSEELLHPERYLDASHRVPLALFPEALALPGCELDASNSYGELGISIWLADAGLAERSAASAAEGWDGDRAWRLRCGERTAAAWLIQLDDEAEARELESALHGRLEWRGDLALRVDRAGARVLMSAGLRLEERLAVLTQPPPRRVATLDDFLREHPDVLERARAVRGR